MARIKTVVLNNDGMTESNARSLWSDTAGFAAYSFNKSHAASYSLISYQTMWLKQNYPVEFYAASLSTVGDAKLQLIVNDAAKRAIKVIPPDVSISTNEFVILNDTTLVMPFNRIKGMSDKGGDAIVKARDLLGYTVSTKVGIGRAATIKETFIPCPVGKFKTMDDFMGRVNQTLVNVRVQDSLKKVGAFSRIIPGDMHALDERRRRDQMVLLPGLMTGVITADREIPSDKFTKARLLQLIRDMNEKIPKTAHTNPVIGPKARYMAVFDAPTRRDEKQGRLCESDDFLNIAYALEAAEFSKTYGYWTSLIKRAKEEKALTPAEINLYEPFLKQELELLKPPVILTLGNAASRYFVPELKGDMTDHVGRTFWNDKLQAMIVIGFNPAQIYHDSEKFDTLVDLFDLVRSAVIWE